MNNQEKTFKFAEIYLRQSTGKLLPYPLYSMRKVKDSKWWKIFSGIIDKFGDDKDFDIYGYISFAIENVDKPYPHKLSNKKVFEEYKELKKARSKNIDKSILLEIKNSLSEIKHWCEKNNKDFGIKIFFDNPKNRMFLLRGKYSKYLLSVTKYFYKELTEEEQNSIMNKNEVTAKRNIIVQNNLLNKKMKEILQGEYQWY